MAVPADKLVYAETSCEGVIKQVNLSRKGRKPEFRIYLVGKPPFIRCDFDERLLPKVRQALNYKARVFGRAQYRNSSPYPELIVVNKLEQLSDANTPELDIEGLQLEPVIEAKSEDYVRSIRDEWGDR